MEVTRILLRGTDRRLLARIRAILLNALNDTPEALGDPDRRFSIEEALADIVEELRGPPEIADPEQEEEEKPIRVRTMNGYVEVKRN